MPIRKVSPVKAFGVIGGVKPFIKFNDVGSNGLVVAIKGANMADRINSIATAADTIATGEWRKA
ncbi:hypothetical protein NBRC116597_30950 [Phaeobacter sp. NW0010-22]